MLQGKASLNTPPLRPIWNGIWDGANGASIDVDPSMSSQAMGETACQVQHRAAEGKKVKMILEV